MFLGLDEEWSSQQKGGYTRLILDVAARINKSEKIIGNIRTRVAQFINVDGGILEHLFLTITNLSFRY
jgi:hypothetical protein